LDQLTALRVFREVVSRGSFTEAARRLRLSPAAISKNIGELEAHLNVRLLNRTTRRMNLTEAGARYYARISRVLDDLSDADRALRAISGVPSGSLRVSAPLTFTLVRLAQAIPDFLERHPQLSLQLQLDDRRVDIVKEGYDVAIRASDNLEDSSLIARKLTTMPHVICAAPSYLSKHGSPREPGDLAAHNCIQFTLSGHADQWEFQKSERAVTVAVNGRYKVTSSLAVREALRGGFGLSLIPRLYIEDDIRSGVLQTVLDDWSKVETSIYAIYPSNRYIDVSVRAFVDFLIGELAVP
jgi:DNA-binding transcriptional LysR family regulator